MITQIDHLVLTVSDIEASVAFYTHVLKLRAETFADNRRALHFGNQKINLHDAQAPYIPHAKTPIPGSLDLCFLSEVSVEQWITVFAKHKISIETGPVQKMGATGPIISVYVRDPDGNLIEISNQL